MTKSQAESDFNGCNNDLNFKNCVNAEEPSDKNLHLPFNLLEQPEETPNEQTRSMRQRSNQTGLGSSQFGSILTYFLRCRFPSGGGLLAVFLVSALCPGSVAQPTISPTIMPTTDSPSQFPTMSSSPTTLPSVSMLPSVSVSPSISPTASPSASPTDSPMPSNAPTAAPSIAPSLSALPSGEPTSIPTNAPTISAMPSNMPTVVPSDRPTTTVGPSFSPSQSQMPSAIPTVSPVPSTLPTFSPSISMAPSSQPSSSPTMEPTYSEIIREVAFFRQTFEINTDEQFNETEQLLFQSTMENYTKFITKEEDIDLIAVRRLNTTCTIIEQDVGIVRRRWLSAVFSRRTQDLINQVQYKMEYISKHANVTGFGSKFQKQINDNLEQLTEDLVGKGLQIMLSNPVVLLKTTEAPTGAPSLVPSHPPTNIPSVPPSEIPTAVPSFRPTEVPSFFPSAGPTPIWPSDIPSYTPTYISEQPSGSGSGDGGTSSTVIVIPLVLIVCGVLIGLLFYYRRRKRRKEMEYQHSAANYPRAGMQEGSHWTGSGTQPTAASNAEVLHVTTDTDEMYMNKYPPPPMANQYDRQSPPGVGEHPQTGILSPTESLMSNQSLLSTGNSIGPDSVDEPDTRDHLADEFDQYKDQNLEKMRTGVEGNLHGFDGMMSHALTKALMEDDDSPNPRELLWGGTGGAMEIEASALGEVNDWLKRNDRATVDEKRSFMQDTLNKMVASVRHGVIGPDHASRAIHECGALLGLQLAEEIPADTLIITGMRKTVKKEDVRKAFAEFGEIEDAAVSAFERGFGLVRFKSPKSVQRAMDKFRTEEIVVQDVAVMVKVLKSETDKRPMSSFFPVPESELNRHSSAPISGNSSKGDKNGYAESE